MSKCHKQTPYPKTPPSETILNNTSGLEVRKTTARFRITMSKEEAFILTSIANELGISIQTLTLQLLRQQLGLSNGNNNHHAPD